MNQDELMALFVAEPKPVTPERLLAIANANLDPLKASQFSDWFTSNGPILVERLNG